MDVYQDGLLFHNKTESVNCSNLSSSSLVSVAIVRKGLNNTYYACALIMSTLSLIGCVLIFYSYWKEKLLRSNLHQLFICLTVCDLFIALGDFIGIVWLWANPIDPRRGDNDWICLMQAVITTTSSIASFLWTTCIAANAFSIVFWNSRVLVNKYRWLLHVICWGIPTISAIVLATENRFGYNPCTVLKWWCWITPFPGNPTETQLARNDRHQLLFWQLFAGKFWEITSYILVCGIYISIKVKLYRYLHKIKKSNLERRNSMKSSLDPRTYAAAQQKLTYIPLVFMIGRIWGTLRFFLSSLNESSDNLATTAGIIISPLQGLGDSSQGFLNFIMLLRTTPQVRNCIKSLFSRRHQPSVRATNASNEDLTSDEYLSSNLREE